MFKIHKHEQNSQLTQPQKLFVKIKIFSHYWHRTPDSITIHVISESIIYLLIIKGKHPLTWVDSAYFIVIPHKYNVELKAKQKEYILYNHLHKFQTQAN